MAEVVTGEAVVLDLAIARFPSRMVALILDLLVQIPVMGVLIYVVVKLSAGGMNAAATAATGISIYVVVAVGYPVIFETLSRGRSLGKMALGLRVVGDDGSPIRFRQALIRALTGVILEIWTLSFIGLIASMASSKGKRLGDMLAGTFVIQERVPRPPTLTAAMAVVPPPLYGWANNAELSRLADLEAAVASSYLRRYRELTPQAREYLGNQIAASLAAQVSPPPPPGTPAPAFISAVLAVRRDREMARLVAQGIIPPPAGFPFQGPVLPGPYQPNLAGQPTISRAPEPGLPEPPAAPGPEDLGFAAPI